MPNVKFQRKEVGEVIPKYELIADAIAGEMAVKAKKQKYLPVPSECGQDENHPRYKAYLTRALYYNVCQPTRDALVGQLFLRPPVIELPENLNVLKDDANGEGLTLEQLIRKAANFVLPYGRGGFLVDFPQTNGEVTKAQIEQGIVRPIIRFFEPWAIRNWKVERKGVVHRLTLLVLDEKVEVFKGDDKFEIEEKIQQRVYRLTDNACKVEIYQDEKKVRTYSVTDRKGEPLESIPFEFVGSENNDAEIDEPPFYSLANLNIAHFRNSADYEESVFLVGQPTPVYSGLTEDWVENYFKGGVPFGSRASITLPVGAKGELLQASPNSLAYEAMTHKEEQMIAIGAKILNPKSKVERKEVEIQIEAAAQKSILTTIKDNLELAIIASLKRAAMFVGDIDTEIKIKLNDNFDLTSMTAEEVRWLIELYTNNGIAFTEFRENLRRSGIAKLADEEAKTEIMADKEMKDALAPEMEKRALEAKTASNDSNLKEPV